MDSGIDDSYTCAESLRNICVTSEKWKDNSRKGDVTIVRFDNLETITKIIF